MFCVNAGEAACTQSVEVAWLMQRDVTATVACTACCAEGKVPQWLYGPDSAIRSTTDKDPKTQVRRRERPIPEKSRLTRLRRFARESAGGGVGGYGADEVGRGNIETEKLRKRSILVFLFFFLQVYLVFITRRFDPVPFFVLPGDKH